jgi:glyoxylase-like metal-dependent hydrolase (beta-lactamase superfamily II)
MHEGRSMSLQNIKTWQIGNVDVTRIVEVNALEDNIAMVVNDTTAEDVKRIPWGVPLFATPDGLMKISFQAFVIKAGDRRIMVDTCIGADRQRKFAIFCNMQSDFLLDLAAAGFPPESIDTVLCTHLHFDHVGWNTRQVDGRWRPTFPNARYLFGKGEYEYLQHERNAPGGNHEMRHVQECIDPIVDAGLATFVDEGYAVTDEITLEPAPGHTPGHVCVRISSRGYTAVITGDLMHTPLQLALLDRSSPTDSDPALGIRTRQAFVKRYGAQRALIIGSHFCDPTAGRIVPDGERWKFEVEADLVRDRPA